MFGKTLNKACGYTIEKTDMLLSQAQIQLFHDRIWSYYYENKRCFSWRENITPYTVFISEVMLQQTQTSRVINKFEEFMGVFPSFSVLAQAPLGDVLRVWQGLGYNRRGKFLHQAAQIIQQDYLGVLPNDPKKLVLLPGIGPATAASVCAFAFNTPTIFIETNIRAVFLHIFFPGRTLISDKELLPLIECTLDYNNAREWYYALMDYGVMLKSQYVNPSRRSKHHAVQSKFEGSDRQIRGAIIRLLSGVPGLTFDQVKEKLGPDNRLEAILRDLSKEGLILWHENTIALP